MKTIVIATNNQNKVKEFRSLFDPTKVNLVTLKEIGFTEEIIEDGTTFEENAIIKAKTVSKKLGVIAVSDDSGLEVDALGGAPGIYSARYAGTGSDDDNNALLIKNLQGIENRRARYACAICVYHPDDTYKTVVEYCEGLIHDEPKGVNGFGYDPYFYIPEFDATFAEVPLEKKNTISHRAKALRHLLEIVDENFDFK